MCVTYAYYSPLCNAAAAAADGDDNVDDD